MENNYLKLDANGKMKSPRCSPYWWPLEDEMSINHTVMVEQQQQNDNVKARKACLLKKGTAALNNLGTRRRLAWLLYSAGRTYLRNRCSART
jgi:hypothetical protein